MAAMRRPTTFRLRASGAPTVTPPAVPPVTVAPFVNASTRMRPGLAPGPPLTSMDTLPMSVVATSRTAPPLPEPPAGPPDVPPTPPVAAMLPVIVMAPEDATSSAPPPPPPPPPVEPKDCDAPPPPPEPPSSGMSRASPYARPPETPGPATRWPACPGNAVALPGRPPPGPRPAAPVPPCRPFDPAPPAKPPGPGTPPLPNSCAPEPPGPPLPALTSMRPATTTLPVASSEIGGWRTPASVANETVTPAGMWMVVKLKTPSAGIGSCTLAVGANAPSAPVLPLLKVCAVATQGATRTPRNTNSRQTGARRIDETPVGSADGEEALASDDRRRSSGREDADDAGTERSVERDGDVSGRLTAIVGDREVGHGQRLVRSGVGPELESCRALEAGAGDHEPQRFSARAGRRRHAEDHRRDADRQRRRHGEARGAR